MMLYSKRCMFHSINNVNRILILNKFFFIVTIIVMNYVIPTTCNTSDNRRSIAVTTAAAGISSISTSKNNWFSTVSNRIQSQRKLQQKQSEFIQNNKNRNIRSQQQQLNTGTSTVNDWPRPMSSLVSSVVSNIFQRLTLVRSFLMNINNYSSKSFIIPTVTAATIVLLSSSTPLITSLLQGRHQKQQIQQQQQQQQVENVHHSTSIITSTGSTFNTTTISTTTAVTIPNGDNTGDTTDCMANTSSNTNTNHIVTLSFNDSNYNNNDNNVVDDLTNSNNGAIGNTVTSLVNNHSSINSDEDTTQNCSTKQQQQNVASIIDDPTEDGVYTFNDNSSSIQLYGDNDNNNVKVSIPNDIIKEELVIKDIESVALPIAIRSTATSSTEESSYSSLAASSSMSTTTSTTTMAKVNDEDEEEKKQVENAFLKFSSKTAEQKEQQSTSTILPSQLKVVIQQQRQRKQQHRTMLPVPPPLTLYEITYAFRQAIRIAIQKQEEQRNRYTVTVLDNQKNNDTLSSIRKRQEEFKTSSIYNTSVISDHESQVQPDQPHRQQPLITSPQHKIQQQQTDKTINNNIDFSSTMQNKEQETLLKAVSLPPSSIISSFFIHQPFDIQHKLPMMKTTTAATTMINNGRIRELLPSSSFLSTSLLLFPSITSKVLFPGRQQTNKVVVSSTMIPTEEYVSKEGNIVVHSNEFQQSISGSTKAAVRQSNDNITEPYANLSISTNSTSNILQTTNDQLNNSNDAIIVQAINNTEYGDNETIMVNEQNDDWNKTDYDSVYDENYTFDADYTIVVDTENDGENENVDYSSTTTPLDLFQNNGFSFLLETTVSTAPVLSTEQTNVSTSAHSDNTANITSARNSSLELTPSFDPIHDEDDTTIPNVHTNEGDIQEQQQKRTVQVRAYCPHTFYQLRQLFGINEQQFESSMLEGSFESYYSNSKGAARVGGVFFFTHDGAYIIKTIKHDEIQSLLYSLPKYYQHMKLYGTKSLLTRICGMYHVQYPATTGISNRQDVTSTTNEIRKPVTYTFIIMNAVFPSNVSHYITERYDLKGSTLGRKCSIKERQQKGSYAILKDLDFIERYPMEEQSYSHQHPIMNESNDQSLSTTTTPLYTSINNTTNTTVLKYRISNTTFLKNMVDDNNDDDDDDDTDNDTIVPVNSNNNDNCNGIHIGSQMKELLLEQLKLDIQLLVDCNMIDYSLLVGICVLPDSGTTGSIVSNACSNTSTKQIQEKKRQNRVIPFGIVRRRQQQQQQQQQKQYHSNTYQCIVNGGILSNIPSRGNNNDYNNTRIIYYIGLIDFLQPYDTKKHIEYLLKSILYEKETFSCIPPILYAKRFLKFFEKYIT